uniref:Transmembrane protein n=1 Tax=Noctiluca scintillans TaxID=2966 RepID=A0A7S1AYF0_NOCSC|mmetsp:Transcript_6463/g.18041  ORF Transcript_6463/g.18041 Transcript_6463/m.18041 type:complete len:497 (+) Transcript_6463:57-1547(+)
MSRVTHLLCSPGGPWAADGNPGFDAVGGLTAACVLTSFALLVAWIGSPRPRMTALFVLLWMMWFVAEMLNGREVWQEMTAMVENASTVTIGLLEMLILCIPAWGVVFMPYLSDVWDRSKPHVLKFMEFIIEKDWNMTWKERITWIVVIVAVAGSIALFWFVFTRVSREMLSTDLMVQSTFLVCGPAIWAGCAQMPLEAAKFTSMVVMSVVPVPWTLSLCLQMERHTSLSQDPLDAGVVPDAWSERMREGFRHLVSSCRCSVSSMHGQAQRMLGYWCCWPLLELCHVGADEISIFERSVHAFVIAVVMFFLLWRGNCLITCALDLGADKLERTASRTLGFVLSSLPCCWRGQSSDVLHRRLKGVGTYMVLALAESLLVIIRTLQGAPLNSIVSTSIVCAAAVESAACVTRGSHDARQSRLVFWCLLVLWRWLCWIPCLTETLTQWAPLALITVIVSSRPLLSALRCVSSSWSRRARRDGLGKSQREPLLGDHVVNGA